MAAARDLRPSDRYRNQIASVSWEFSNIYEASWRRGEQVRSETFYGGPNNETAWYLFQGASTETRNRQDPRYISLCLSECNYPSRHVRVHCHLEFVFQSWPPIFPKAIRPTMDCVRRDNILMSDKIRELGFYSTGEMERVAPYFNLATDQDDTPPRKEVVTIRCHLFINPIDISAPDSSALRCDLPFLFLKHRNRSITTTLQWHDHMREMVPRSTLWGAEGPKFVFHDNTVNYRELNTRITFDEADLPHEEAASSPPAPFPRQNDWVGTWRIWSNPVLRRVNEPDAPETVPFMSMQLLGPQQVRFSFHVKVEVSPPDDSTKHFVTCHSSGDACLEAGNHRILLLSTPKFRDVEGYKGIPFKMHVRLDLDIQGDFVPGGAQELHSNAGYQYRMVRNSTDQELRPAHTFRGNTTSVAYKDDGNLHQGLVTATDSERNAAEDDPQGSDSALQGTAAERRRAKQERRSPSSPTSAPCTLTNDLGKVLNDKTYSDLVFRVQGRELYAHKAILVSRSDIFSKTVGLLGAYHTGEDVHSIDIEDVEYDVFEELLRYVYTDKVPNVDKMAGKLFAAADKYALYKLKDFCEERACDRMTIESAGMDLLYALMHGGEKLKTRALDFVKIHKKAVFKTDGWKNMRTNYRTFWEEAMEELV